MIDVPYFSHCGIVDNKTPLEGVRKVFDNVNTPDKELFIVDCQGHGCSSQSEEARERENSFIDNFFVEY